MFRLGAAMAALAGVACGALLADDPDEPVPADGGTPDAHASDDASSLDVGPAPSALCSIPRAPSCVPEDCPRRTLYASPSKAAPHGIVADDTFVYWLEQPATDLGYNGHEAARLLRVDKLGANDTSHAMVLATGQMAATALALDDGWLYWTVYEHSGSGGALTSVLRKVPASCGAAGCPPPTDLVAFAPGVRLTKLVRVARGVLFALGEAGHVSRIDVGGGGAVRLSAATEKSGEASVIGAGEHVFIASSHDEEIARMDLEGTSLDPSYFVVPERDGGDEGISNMWTDCTDAWAVRGPSASIVRFGLSDGQFTTIAQGLSLSIYGTSGDAEYLYVAGANEGVAALGRQTQTLTLVHRGKAFALAVDDDGVYWGEHDIGASSAGTIYMMVK